MTDDKVLDVIARLLDALDKQATPYALKWRTLRQCWNFPILSVLTWIRLPRYTWPKTWQNVNDESVALPGRILYGHPFPRLLWDSLFAHRQQGLFLSVYLDGIKMAGEKNIMLELLEKLMHQVDLETPTTFLD